MFEYSFCETSAATSTSSWHIRKLTDKGRKLGGGADTKSLCDRKVAWDLEVELTLFHLTKNTCRDCAAVYRETKCLSNLTSEFTAEMSGRWTASKPNKSNAPRGASDHGVRATGSSNGAGGVFTGKK